MQPTISLLAAIAAIGAASADQKVVPLSSTVPAVYTTHFSNNVKTPDSTHLYATATDTTTFSSSDTLQRGDVFGLMTLSTDPEVNGGTVVIYNDGTLGIKEPTGPGYLFEALLLREYNLLVAPEPLTTVKTNNNGVFYLNTSLFNPSPIFSERNFELQVAGGSPVVCPSWNSVLVLAKDNENVPCEDAVSVKLGIVPITV